MSADEWEEDFDTQMNEDLEEEYCEEVTPDQKEAKVIKEEEEIQLVEEINAESSSNNSSAKQDRKKKDQKDQDNTRVRRGFTFRLDDIDLDDEYTAFYCVEKTMKFPLLPAAIGQEQAVINQVLLHRWKGSYINQLGGVLCYFDRVKLLNQKSEIVDDLPYIYAKFNARFFVFKPTVNSLAKAKITCFPEGNNMLNCSIAECFNAIITLPEEIPEKLNEYLVLNQEIIFRITQVSYSPMTVFGNIDKKCIKMIRKQIPIVSKKEEKKEEVNLDDFFVS